MISHLIDLISPLHGANMPLYEYVCTSCGHEFEVIQSFSAEPIRICEQCNQETVKKKISNSGFILKGGGWYKDHYGLKKSAPSESPSSSDTSSSDSSPASSSSDKD